jgi:hypothetical protein
MALTYSFDAGTNSYTVTGACGDATITIPDTHDDGEHGEADVLTIGVSAFQGCKSLTSVIISNTLRTIDGFAFKNCTNLTNVTIGESVEIIGNQAFNGCTSLATIYIPYSVSEIGNNAFKGCTALISVAISDSVYAIGNQAFQNCTSLTSINLENGIIGDNMFAGCTGLISVTIPSSVTIIGYGAFSNCTGLTSINLENGIIGDGMFSGCTGLTGTLIIPNGITSIGENSFAFCTGLISATIPNSATNIQPGVFYNCTSLTSFTLGSGVSYIADSMFQNCTALINISIPNFITNIFVGAFKGCTGLTSITIPNSVTNIYEEAFYQCSNLANIIIGNSVTNIGVRAFSFTKVNNVIIPNSVINIGGSAFESCTSLSNITIGNNVQTIGDTCFLETDISSIVFPNSVTFVGGSMFEQCNNLKNVILGNGITSIPGYFFYDCPALSELTFGSGVTAIGANAFYNCTSLKKINIPNKLTTISDYAFFQSGLEELNIPQNVTSIGAHAFEECASLKTVTIGKGPKTLGSFSFTLNNALTRMNFLGNKAEIRWYSDTFGDGNANLKFYRYSTSTGWSPLGYIYEFDAYDIIVNIPILLIDSPIDQGLQSFGFVGASAGNVSAKKINLGRGKISLLNEIVPSLGLSLWLKADEGVTYTSQLDGSQIVIIDLTGYMQGRYIREGFPEPDISFWMYAGGSAYIYYDSNVGKFYLKDTDRDSWDVNIAESTDGVNWTSYYQLPISITINGCTGYDIYANGTYGFSGFYGPDNEYTYYFSSNDQHYAILGNPLTGWTLWNTDNPVFRLLCTNATETATGSWTNVNVTGTVTSTSSLFPNRSGTVYFTQEGYNVTSWKDNSGNGRDASQILGFAPLYLTDILNGKPVISFDNNNLFSANQNLNKDSTIFVVVIPTNNNASLVSTDANGLFFRLSASPENSLKVGINNIEIANDNQINSDAMIISTTRSNNLNSKIYKDGAFVTQGNYNTSSLNPINELILGGSGGSQIAEILIYNIALNDKKLQKLNSYLSKKYAIDLQAISYNSGGANPLEYSGKGLVNNHFIGGLYGSGETDATTWTTTFKILKKGILYYSFNLESSAGNDYASSTLNSNIIFAHQSGFIQSNGNINVNINDIITVTYSKNGSGESAGFDGIRFDFYIV